MSIPIHTNGTSPVRRREKLYRELIHRKAVLTDFQHLPTVIYDWQTAEGPYFPNIYQRLGEGNSNGAPQNLMEMRIERHRHLMASNSIMPLIAPYEVYHPGDLVYNVRYTICAALEYLNPDGTKMEPRVVHGPDAHSVIIRTTYSTPPRTAIQNIPHTAPGGLYSWDNIGIEAVQKMLYAHGMMLFGADGKRRVVPLEEEVVKDLMEEVEEAVRGCVGEMWGLGENTIGCVEEEEKLDKERALRSR
ncbi:uncharacterized protein EAF01_001502 [Botrytis porri]|uniref:uncharacterized protein n=1 Tax=Botrytis porri TaxID=87229 RepID=UPI0018FF39BD|nr:uncharacterized protein EAF01_001502 [Botrytis porri]KAF7912481.1 hypothetical protein EAF01_001502 [Botrytis porri]